MTPSSYRAWCGVIGRVLPKPAALMREALSETLPVRIATGEIRAYLPVSSDEGMAAGSGTSLMKSQSCLWSRPNSRAHERLNVITIADVNMWISMVISHRKCCIMRFCVSLLQVSMCISISNCFSDNVSFWRVMSYLYEVTSCVR